MNNTAWLVDYHMHTEYSPDSTASMADMCEAAVAAGLSSIAVTDHVEIPAFLADGYDRTLAASFTQAGEMQRRFSGRLPIARGMELGEPLHDRATAESVLEAYAFDFVLASVHNLKDDEDFYFYDFSTADVNAVMDRYFEELLDTTRWGRFHSLAHLTYPFRYVPADKRPADYRRWQDQIDEIFRALAHQGLALEINTSGLRQPIRQTLPTLPLVRRFRELGGERITLGSDAHRSEDVGSHIAEGVAIAGQAGFRHIAVYRGGQACMVPLD